MQRFIAFICALSLALIIGTAGALEQMYIGIGQATLQMFVGLSGFALTSAALLNGERTK